MIQIYALDALDGTIWHAKAVLDILEDTPRLGSKVMPLFGGIGLEDKMLALGHYVARSIRFSPEMIIDNRAQHASKYPGAQLKRFALRELVAWQADRPKCSDEE